MKGGHPSKMTYIKDHLLKDHPENNEADCLPANRIRDSQAELLSARLLKYFGKPPAETFVEAVRCAVLHAYGEPASDALIIEELNALERVYPRGHRKGPHVWKWFETTLANRFAEARQAREARALPPVASTPSPEPWFPGFLRPEEEQE
jgi:hypothetical protein